MVTNMRERFLFVLAVSSTVLFVQQAVVALALNVFWLA